MGEEKDYKQKILDFINNNAKLQDDEGEKCLCISGKWGVGKTFIWKEVEKDKSKKSAKQIVYISLFGKEHYKEIIEEIVMKLNSRNKLVKLTESFEKINLKISPLGLGIDIAALLSLFEKKDFENIIICFDDIERKSSNISMKDFLGLVFQLKEDRKCRVVLILNEESSKEELSEEDKEQFSLYKEKCIDFYLKIESREKVIEGILKRIIQDDDIERYILELDGPIYKIENLREVKRIAECVNYFNQKIFSLYKDNKDADTVMPYIMKDIVEYFTNQSKNKNSKNSDYGIAIKNILDYYTNNAGQISKDIETEFKKILDSEFKDVIYCRIFNDF